MKVDEVLTEALKGIKNVLDVDTVIGKPVFSDGVMVIPITKMTIGFMTATAELEPRYSKMMEGIPMGSIGGGATINPIGFLIIDNTKVKFISVEGGEFDKWSNIINLAKDWFLR